MRAADVGSLSVPLPSHPPDLFFFLWCPEEYNTDELLSNVLVLENT